MCRSRSGSSSAAARPVRLGLLGLTLGLAGLPAAPAAAQDELPCEGVLEDPGRLASVLSQVPKYGSTYVLVYPDARAEEVGSLDLALAEGVRLGIYTGDASSALAASAPGSTPVSLPQAGAGAIVQQVLDESLDAGLLWAPLAGLGILQLDLNYDLSMLTVGTPSAAPAAFVGATKSGGDADAACANEVLALLESYGVVPAEKLVPLDIRELVHLRPPSRDLAAARQGVELYTRNCSKCHGAEAVAATDELAPVDLLVSTRRFSFPGFLYIVWNGREEKGMPGWRGALTQEQVTQIYQYARERSYGTLGVTGNYPVPEQQSDATATVN